MNSRAEQDSREDRLPRREHFIYAGEGYEPARTFLHDFFLALDRRLFAVVTSELALVEVLVKPIRFGGTDAVASCMKLLCPSGRMEVAPVSRTILIEAARQAPCSACERLTRSMWRPRLCSAGTCS